MAKAKEPVQAAPVTDQATIQAPVEIQVPIQVAVQIKVLEFDKAIAEAEAQLAALKRDKMVFVYDQNVKMVQQQYQTQPQQAEIQESPKAS